MRPHPNPMLRGGRRTELVGASDQALAGSAVYLTLPGSPQVGDYCLIFVDYSDVNTNTLLSTAGGWTFHSHTWSGLGYWSNVFHKRLEASDLVASDLHFSTTSGGAILSIVIYRGPRLAVLKEVAESLVADLTFAGITKVSCAGLVTHISCRDASVTQTRPTRFAARTARAEGYFRTAVADLLNPNDYASGAPITWTTTTPAFLQISHLYELRT